MESIISNESPIIIIGAGRSGTSLLTAMLSLHPDISFHGETAFYIPRTWSHLMEYYDFFISWKDIITDYSLLGTVPTEEHWSQIRYKEEKRMANILINSLIDIVGIDRSKRHWGYKEIWNGSNAFFFDWKIYDQIFPQATWVQIIRNPFKCVDSQARLNGNEFTKDFLLDRLSDWTSMVNYSRLRKQTGRYFEFRYEDLLDDPRGILAPLFNSLGIGWSDLCAKALSNKWAPARHNRPHNFPKINSAIPGLYELIEELHYLEDLKYLGINLNNPRDNFLKEQVVIELNNFQYHNECYLSHLGNESSLAFLHLYENHQKIGPVVNNIKIVQKIGKGSYCFANLDGSIYLMMSPSDNTDPRTNSRKYTLRN